MSDNAAPVTVPLETIYKAQLVDLLANEPKTRLKLLKLVKEFSPNVRIHEIDTEEMVLERLKPLQEELQREREERVALALERQREAQRAKARERGLSADEVTEVEKLAAERQIGDFDTAIEHYQLSRRAAAPRSMPGPIELPAIDKDFAKAAAQPGMAALNQWARRQAYQILNERR